MCQKFENEKEFYDSISRGGEIEFLFRNKHYSIIHHNSMTLVVETGEQYSEKCYLNSRDVGNYEIDGIKLRDLLNDIDIVFRSL